VKRQLRLFVAIVAFALALVPAVNLGLQGPARMFEPLRGEHLADEIKARLYNFDFALTALARTLYPLGISIDPDQVVIGRDGWLYLGDKHGQTLTAHRAGLRPGDTIRAAAIAQAMLRWDEWLQRQGVTLFRLMIGPDKHSVHHEGLPDWAVGRTPAKVQALLRSPAGHLYIDLGPTLRRGAAAGQPQLYYRTDTHWTALGAAHAFGGLGEALHTADPALAWPDTTDIRLAHVDPRQGGDLARFLRLETQLQDLEPVVAQPDTAHIAVSVNEFLTGAPVSGAGNPPLDSAKTPLLVRSPSALNKRKLLWVRDSFGTALSPYMALTFNEVVQVHYSDALKDGGALLSDLVQRWRPDIALVTVVERDALLKLFETPPP
jgi:hypothetical protein